MRTMTNRFRCRDVGQKCGYVQKAPTTEELLPKVEEHLRTSHGMATLDPEMRQKITAAIREVAPPAAASATSVPQGIPKSG